MELLPSAHVDTFCRDHLPPSDQWPELIFELPELHYPDRLNCATALLDDVIAEHGADRPCLHCPGCRHLVVRRPAGRRQPDRPRAGRRPRRRARQPGAAARPQQPLADRVLVRRAQGRRGRGHHDAAAAGRRAGHDPRDRPARPGPGRPAVRGGHRGALGARGARRDVRRRGRPGRAGRRQARHPSTTSPPPPTTSPCWRSRPAPPGARRRRCTSTATCWRSATPSPATCCARPPTTCSPAPRRTPSRSAWAACCCSRCTRARRRCWSRRRRPCELAAIIDDFGVTTCFTAPTAYKAMLAAGAKLPSLRAAVSAGEHLPAATWQAFRDATGVRIIDGIGATEMLHIFIGGGGRRHRAGVDGQGGARLSRHGARRERRRGAARRARPARGEGADRVPLPRRPPAARLRRGRLEHHRRHVHPGRRRATSATRRAATT